MMDRDTGRPRGFGFVTFEDESSVERLLSRGMLEIDGKMVRSILFTLLIPNAHLLTTTLSRLRLSVQRPKVNVVKKITVWPAVRGRVLATVLPKWAVEVDMALVLEGWSVVVDRPAWVEWVVWVLAQGWAWAVSTHL